MVSVQGWRLLVADPVDELRSTDDLDRFATEVGWRGARPTGVPFSVAAVGVLSDDLSAGLLELPPDTRPAFAPVPAVRFGVYDWAVAVTPDGTACIVAEPDKADALLRWVTATTPAPDGAAPVKPRTARFGLTPSQHAAAVEQILAWIAAGDLYQANLTMQVSVPWDAPPAELAARLEAATPGAAHAALLTLDDGVAVVSASPETFLRVTGDQIRTRPIKGTRPRGPDERSDRAAAEALVASAKDHAEHVMIVDLERNDLGRVCDPGSVVVPEYAALEGHPTVWHLTSTVAGTLRDGVGLGEVIAATFPPGSVTGTPKRMAVDRTRLLEPVRRGVYCGAVGVVGPGLVDLSVAIRTAVVHDGVASYGAGGGIVADSTAAGEYAEALAKAAAFLRATNATLG